MRGEIHKSRCACSISNFFRLPPSPSRFRTGETQRFPTIIVNRQYLDLLALEAGT